MEVIVVLDFSPEYVKERLGLHLHKEKIYSDILTEFENDALSRLNHGLGLNLKPDFQRTEKGLTLIFEEIKNRGWQKIELHNCGVSVITLGAICAKIFYGQKDYRPHQLFDRVTMVRRPVAWVNELNLI